MLARFLAERLPDREDVLGEVCLFDHRVGPETPHQLVLLDDPVPVLDQHEQRLDRLRWERDRLCSAAQPAAAHVEAELVEDVDGCLRPTRNLTGFGR